MILKFDVFQRYGEAASDIIPVFLDFESKEHEQSAVSNQQ
jgi:hypothetical protein